ncbi:hypothetical protein Tco_0250686 [Tanacetum coccineum]
MTSQRWSVSTVTSCDTLQGNAEDLGIKITGAGIKTTLEGTINVEKFLPKPCFFHPNNYGFSYSEFEEFNACFEGYGPKISKSVSEDISNEVMKSPDAPLVEELVLNDKLEKKTVFPTVAKINFVTPTTTMKKPVRKTC